MGYEKRMVIDKIREEIYQLHLADASSTLEANETVLIAEPAWNLKDSRGRIRLEHYNRCISYV